MLARRCRRQRRHKLSGERNVKDRRFDCIYMYLSRTVDSQSSECWDRVSILVSIPFQDCLSTCIWSFYSSYAKHTLIPLYFNIPSETQFNQSLVLVLHKKLHQNHSVGEWYPTSTISVIVASCCVSFISVMAGSPARLGMSCLDTIRLSAGNGWHRRDLDGWRVRQRLRRVVVVAVTLIAHCYALNVPHYSVPHSKWATITKKENITWRN